jgi:hypothetical protein
LGYPESYFTPTGLLGAKPCLAEEGGEWLGGAGQGVREEVGGTRDVSNITCKLGYIREMAALLSCPRV